MQLGDSLHVDFDDLALQYIDVVFGESIEVSDWDILIEQILQQQACPIATRVLF